MSWAACAVRVSDGEVSDGGDVLVSDMRRFRFVELVVARCEAGSRVCIFHVFSFIVNTQMCAPGANVLSSVP